MDGTEMVPETPVIFYQLTKMLPKKILSVGDLYRYVVII
jgi:hypothetical protein